jgi:hypothetical protein
MNHENRRKHMNKHRQGIINQVTFSLTEAANVTDVSVSTLRRLIYEGRLDIEPRQYSNQPIGLTTEALFKAGLQVGRGNHRRGISQMHTETAGKPSGKGKLQSKAKEALSVVKVCAYCKDYGTYDKGPDGKSWHMDHIIPWAVRPLESLSNYVKACHTCNMRKGAQRIYPSANTYTACGKRFADTWVYQELIEAGEL